ncbi:MAG TPA: hypothetical protein VNQ74_09040, partial [Burkholderiaceae bacterium]|nr:hypothetical protein [Burkholderiaceae bacterium]
IRQRAVEVENGEAIGSHVEKRSSGKYRSAPKPIRARLPVSYEVASRKIPFPVVRSEARLRRKVVHCKKKIRRCIGVSRVQL